MNARIRLVSLTLIWVLFHAGGLAYAKNPSSPIKLVPDLGAESSEFPQDSGWRSHNPDLVAKIKPERVIYFEFIGKSSGFIEYSNFDIKSGRYKIQGQFAVDGNRPSATIEQDDSQGSSILEVNTIGTKKIAKTIDIKEDGITLTFWIRCFGKCWGTIRNLTLIPVP